MDRFIDSHVHCGGPDRGDGVGLSFEDLINKMDMAGVERAVIFPFNSPGENHTFHEANSYILEAVDNHPDRLIGFMRIDPRRKTGALEEIDIYYGKGLKGIKLHPKSQDFGPDHAFLYKILEKAQEYDLPVVFDTGKPIFPNKAFLELAFRFPEVNIILAHLRGMDSVPVVSEYPNLYQGLAKAAELEGIKKAVDVLGAGKIIAGSDTPYGDMRFEMVDKFRDMELSSRELDRIRRKNIEALIKK